jgi:N6-adenosine-specific RNA methylase IME4/ParB-like chromosome segregation protein Spo0J
VGLINPITVTANHTLIAGAHRLEAVKLLGKAEIDATVIGVSGLRAELAEIDENLVRNELDPVTMGELANRRDEILKELGQRAMVGQGRPKENGELNSPFLNPEENASETAPLKTTAAIAKEMGVSERVLQQNKQLARYLVPEAKQAVRAVDTPKTEALKLARMEPEKQKAIAEKLVTGEAKSIVDAERQIKRETITAKYEAPKSDGVIDIYTTVKKYRVVYADPPWSYGDPRSGQGTTGATDHYPTMPLKDICALPIKNIVEENSVLFLWVTSPLLEDCFEVIRAWGFKYKASFVWDKLRHNMGHYNSVRHEFLLVCTHGGCKPDIATLVPSVQGIERTEHSKKPEEFRGIIDTLYPAGNRIELFSRQHREKWDAWGFEA